MSEATEQMLSGFLLPGPLLPALFLSSSVGHLLLFPLHAFHAAIKDWNDFPEEK